jgi:alkyl sulfatase BDS1-like metallo-beta-lactamase superfamily hydrolase
MPTRRQVVQGISATLPFSFVVETVAPGATGSLAYAQAVANHEALAGHFHPKGKPPSRFTIALLQQARGTLPFADQRDFEEQQRGLIAPDLQIMADAGHVAWDMERFRFLDQQDDFDSIHPSLHGSTTTTVSTR